MDGLFKNPKKEVLMLSMLNLGNFEFVFCTTIILSVVIYAAIVPTLETAKNQK
jgi:hypothetical protein